MQEYVITAIVQKKNNKTRYELYLDGEQNCVLTDESVAIFRLKEGQTLTESQLNDILDTTETQIAFDKCLNLLGKSMKTSGQVKDYLRQKGFNERVALNVMNKLKEYKYVDDYAYTAAFVAQNKSSKGLFRLKREMALKGISEEIIDAVLSTQGDEDESENAFYLAERFTKGKCLDVKSLARLNRHLLSRGFGFDTINTVVNRLKEKYGFSDDCN